MASNNVNLGIGMASATGMFFTAPAGTALPTSPFDTLAADWTKVGDITSDGITWATGKDSEPLRNWAKETVRLASSDEGGTVTAPIMDTTEDTLKAIFGSSNVTVTPADSRRNRERNDHRSRRHHIRTHRGDRLGSYHRGCFMDHHKG